MSDETHEEYLVRTIEEASQEALDNAKWLAEHTVRFMHVIPRNESNYYIAAVRRSEIFHCHEWVDTKYVSRDARANFRDALKMVENVELIIKKLGRKADKKIGE